MGIEPIYRAISDLSIFLHSKNIGHPFSLFGAPMIHIPQKTTVYCLLLTIVPAIFCGCVQRRLQIRSQPEGALVSVDRQPVGATPVSVPYTYSGTREIQLEKDGFKTVRVDQNIRPAWFDLFPVSLVTNNFAFREFRDDRVFDFALEPKEAVSESVLYERANDMRQNIQRGTLTAPIDR